MAGAHETAGGGLSKERLVTDFGLTPDVIERIVARLKARGLIAEVRGDINGYIPGRAADSIALEDVSAPFAPATSRSRRARPRRPCAPWWPTWKTRGAFASRGSTIASLLPGQEARAAGRGGDDATTSTTRTAADQRTRTSKT